MTLGCIKALLIKSKRPVSTLVPHKCDGAVGDAQGTSGAAVSNPWAAGRWTGSTSLHCVRAPSLSGAVSSAEAASPCLPPIQTFLLRHRNPRQGTPLPSAGNWYWIKHAPSETCGSCREKLFSWHSQCGESGSPGRASNFLLLLFSISSMSVSKEATISTGIVLLYLSVMRNSRFRNLLVSNRGKGWLSHLLHSLCACFRTGPQWF